MKCLNLLNTHQPKRNHSGQARKLFRSSKKLIPVKSPKLTVEVVLDERPVSAVLSAVKYPNGGFVPSAVFRLLKLSKSDCGGMNDHTMILQMPLVKKLPAEGSDEIVLLASVLVEFGTVGKYGFPLVVSVKLMIELVAEKAVPARS